MQEKTKEFATIKQAVRLQQWSELIKSQQASGLTIKQWCEGNGIKPNTYYCRLSGLNTEQYLTELFSHPTGTILLPFNT